MASLARSLTARGARLPVPRFDARSAELMRFAAACGLLEAETEEARSEALAKTTMRILETLQWLDDRSFMSSAQLGRWEHLVRWQGHDTEGRPLLVVRLARACKECQSHRIATFAEAIISQVNKVVKELLSNDAASPEQIVAIIDMREASAFSMLRRASLLSGVAATLCKHYPHRLAAAYVVGPSRLLGWAWRLGSTSLPSSTGAKVKQLEFGDPALPLPSAALDLPPHKPPAAPKARGGSALRRSISMSTMDAVRGPKTPRKQVSLVSPTEAAELARMAEEEGDKQGSTALPQLRTRLAQGLSHSASNSPRCHSARLASSPRSSAPTLLENSDLSLTTNSLLEPLLDQRLSRPRRPPMPTLTGLSGFAAMLEERNSGLAAVTEELHGPASEPRPPSLRRGMAGSGLPSSTSTASPRGTPRTPRGSLRRDPSTRRPGTMGESVSQEQGQGADNHREGHRLQRQGRSLDSAFREARASPPSRGTEQALANAQAALPSLMLVMFILAMLQRLLIPFSGSI
ncbi:hypothetical protein WJX74_002768 [Apatococcus lobatus]